MNARLDLFAVAPAVMKSWSVTANTIAGSLEPSLVELVKIRSSQINGCANCLNLHTTEARANGESEQRLYLLSAWREAPCYSERERAALAWTDAMTRLSEGVDRNVAYEQINAHFSQEEQVKLTLIISVINGWNRLALGFGIWFDIEAARANARASTA